MAWLNTIWSFLLFLPIFLLLFLLGLIKGFLFGSLALVIIFVGNVSVALWLWPAFIYWSYSSVLRTKQLVFSLKLVAAVFCLPVILVAWPSVVVGGSAFAGLGYGFFTPLVATFEAAGEGKSEKFRSTILDGTWTTVQGSCTVVRDFADWCYHSCPAYLADFRDAEASDGPYGISFLEMPVMLITAVIGVVVDVPLFTLIAAVKSPFMLFKGWARLLDDLIVSRDGACLKVACVPLAGLAIMFWPLVVQISVSTAVVCSVFVGLYAAVIVHKEKSFKSGLAYTITMVSVFDEYTNDMLYLREGSCLPRPSYAHVSSQETPIPPTETELQRVPQSGGLLPQLSTTKSIRQTIQEVPMIQVWEHMFKSCAKNSQELIQMGVLKASDLEQYLNDSDNSKMIAVKLPAYSLLKNLINSAKLSSTGLMMQSGVELTMFNRPQNRLMDYFFEPLLILKEQLKAAQLQPGEERYLEKLTLLSAEAEWEGSVEPKDGVRKAEFEALSRRIQGISTSVSRFPTFRRRYEKFIKSLLVYAQSKDQIQNVDVSLAIV